MVLLNHGLRRSRCSAAFPGRYWYSRALPASPHLLRGAQLSGACAGVRERRKEPALLLRQGSDMIVEDGSTVPYPPLTNNYHHEVELVAAIGKGGANIP